MHAPARTARRLWALSATPRFLQTSAAVTVAALAIGVVSGGAVRLTGSGLGCSDWPACTATSVVAPLQFHAWVEFGNRLVNVVITIGIVLVALASLRRRPRRSDLAWLSWGLVAGVFAEIVLGGLTVLNKLAPPFVMAHFLLAMVLVVDAAVLYQRCRRPDVPLSTPSGAGAAPGTQTAEPRSGLTGEGVGPVAGPGRRAVPAPGRQLVRRGHILAGRAMLAWTFVVITLGTVVTSTGPHAGAPGVPRFHFSLHTVAQLHGTSVELLLALTVATMWSMHRSRVPQEVFRRAELLLVVLVAQAGVGYTQYLTGDPVELVAVHLTGATVLVVAMVFFNMGLYAYDPVTRDQTVQVGVTSARELARI